MERERGASLDAKTFVYNEIDLKTYMDIQYEYLLSTSNLLFNLTNAHILFSPSFTPFYCRHTVCFPIKLGKAYGFQFELL